MELHLRFGGRPLAVALEQRRGALAVMLGKYAHLHLYPVHPMTLAKFRQAWYPSRSKSDPSDADGRAHGPQQPPHGSAEAVFSADLGVV
jgi:hypothetical protein